MKPKTKTTTKHCIYCKRLLPATTEFFYKSPIRRRGRKYLYLRSECKECVMVKVEERRSTIRAFVEQERAAASCAMCGYDDAAALDFHHVNGGTKEFTIGWVVCYGYSLGRVKAELAKCIVLCSNCHRKHHAALRRGRDGAVAPPNVSGGAADEGGSAPAVEGGSQ